MSNSMERGRLGELDDRWEPDRWPLDWRALDPHERWQWFERLWFDACGLRERYELPVRTLWWKNQIALEALVATAEWVRRYDSGEWDDPPGKLALLYDLERVSALLRDGNGPFDPERDRLAYVEHMVGLGCEPPERDG